MLGQVEARERRILHVGFGDVPGFMVNINLRKEKQCNTLASVCSDWKMMAVMRSRPAVPPYLSGGFAADELVVDLLSFGR